MRDEKAVERDGDGEVEALGTVPKILGNRRSEKDSGLSRPQHC